MKKKKICQWNYTKYTSMKSLFMSYTMLLLKMYLVSRISEYFNWKVGQMLNYILLNITIDHIFRLQLHFFTSHIILSIAQLLLYSLAFIHVKLNMSTLNKIICTHTIWSSANLYIIFFFFYACVVTYSLFVITYTHRHDSTCIATSLRAIGWPLLSV